jgi:3-hydroxy-9,10-secoandrosta-1,3,5(10)-triene-9,17-dione monooxygenase reductase component
VSRDRIRALEPDIATYRTVLGHFATGVTLITAMDGDEPVGMACNSFTSVSLDPPLVLFCAAKASSTWPKIQPAQRFAANILSEDDEELCRLFATKGADRFKHIAWSDESRTGSPLIHDALAFVDCETVAEHDAGDHVIVVGRVVELGYASEGKPLLFYRGGYGHFES